jgi:hypothetical protein
MGLVKQYLILFTFYQTLILNKKLIIELAIAPTRLVSP